MHGGNIHAESDGVGMGSRFVVRIPVIRNRSTKTGPAGSVTLEGPRNDGKKAGARILVVDDNVDTANMMCRLLTLLGHEVRVAFDGMSGLEVAESFNPAFILLDIGLPGMDGFTVASRLRQDRRYDQSIIVAVSGYGQDEDRRRSREAGFDYHLVKPVDHEHLFSILADTPNGRTKAL
jgi:CheY-like chemotaxis protein